MTAAAPPPSVHANVPIVSAADLQLTEQPVSPRACAPPFDRLPEKARGRDEEIDKLLDLGRAPAGSVAVLSGEAGSGKSTIALAAARTLASEHRVLWVAAHNRTAFLDGMAAVALSLGAPVAETVRAREEQSADPAWKMLAVRSGPARTVLVIDGADDTRLAEDVVHEALNLVPALRFVVLTTRVTGRLSPSTSVVTIEVGRPPLRACADLLLDRIRDWDPPRRRAALAEAEKAAELLGRVPLALHVIGCLHGSAVVRHTLAACVGELSRAPRRRSGLRAGEPAFHVVPAIVLALATLDPEERGAGIRALSLLASCAPGQPFPLEALIDVLNPHPGTADGTEPPARRAIRLLVQTGIVTMANDGHAHAVLIHPLIAKAISHVREARATTGITAAAALDAITRKTADGTAAFIDSDLGTWPLWRMLAPHVAQLLAAPRTGAGRPALNAAHRVIHRLLDHGMYPSAVELARTVVDRAAELPEDDRAGRRRADLDLGLALQSSGNDLAEAYRLVHDVAVRARRDCAPDDPELMNAGHCLATILHERGDTARPGRSEPSGPEKLFREVLDARTRVLGDTHPDTLATMHGLARVLHAAGRAEEAERMLTTVHAGRRQLLGEDHPDTLAARHSIAYARQAAGGPGSLAEAEQEFARVLADRRRVLGETHPNTLVTQHNLAWIEQAKGHYPLAEQQFRDVMARQLVRLDKRHPHTVATAANLAWDLLQQREFAIARLLFLQVLKIRIGRLGILHPDTQTTRGNLGWLTYEEGDFSRSEHRFRKLLLDREKTLGPDHPRTLTTRHNLALSLRSQPKLSEARREFIAVLDDQERVLAESHDSVLATRYNLAVTLRMLRQKEWLTQAMTLLDSVLITLRGRSDPHHPLLRQTKREIVTLLAIRSGRADAYDLVADDGDDPADQPATTLDDPLVQEFVDADIDEFDDPDLRDYQDPPEAAP